MNSIRVVSDLDAGRAALLSGDAQGAIASFSRAVDAHPADFEARYGLASARLAAGAADAAATMDEARILHVVAELRGSGVDVPRCRTDAAYAADIAKRLNGHDLVVLSSVVWGMALSTGDFDIYDLLSYALVLQHQGRIDEALAVLRAGYEAVPSRNLHQFQVYPQLFLDEGEARHFAAAREWARLFAPPRPCPPHANPPRAGRRLRIGYVAPRFAGCQLEQFIAPLLENHDPETVAVTLYPTEAETEARWPSWIDVHPLGGLDENQAAGLIRADRIDVLSDCWGHTAGSRLTTFACRPAPVQVGWINFIQSTGLDQIDYVLHADAAAPPPVEGLYSERIWRTGPVFNAFRPAAGRLGPAPTPALATGQVTFGSFNHPAKLSDATLDAWAAVLRQAPASRLLLKYRYFADPVLQRVTQARFLARGVEPDRLAFAGQSLGEAYLEAFREVDLMLDAWPAPGSTTTLDALSNGAPVLTMAMPTVGGHYVRSILEACGLHELVCETSEAFVARAVELASDAARLDALRARVRPGFDNGPCRDEAGFTRRVEAAFGEMFDLWRARSGGGG